MDPAAEREVSAVVTLDRELVRPGEHARISVRRRKRVDAMRARGRGACPWSSR